MAAPTPTKVQNTLTLTKGANYLHAFRNVLFGFLVSLFYLFMFFFLLQYEKSYKLPKGKPMGNPNFRQAHTNANAHIHAPKNRYLTNKHELHISVEKRLLLPLLLLLLLPGPTVNILQFATKIYYKQMATRRRRRRRFKYVLTNKHAARDFQTLGASRG